MHKLIAIFLAIGAINVVVVQSKSTLNVQYAGGKILKFFGISNGGTNKVETDDIVEKFEDLSEDKISTFGPALIKFANSLYEVNVAKDAMQSDVYNLKFNPQSIANYFNQYDGDLSLENTLVAILNVLPSLKEALSSSESSATTTQQPTNVFVKFVSSSKKIPIKSIVSILKQLSNQDVKKFGPVCIQIAKLNGYTMTENNIPSKAYNLPINLQTIINKFNKMSEPINVQTFFKMFGINLNFKTTTTPAPTTTTTAKSTISLMIEWAKLCGFELTKDVMPSNIFNLKVNFSDILSIVNEKTGSISIPYLCKLFGITISHEIPNTNITVPDTVSSDFKTFITTKEASTILIRRIVEGLWKEGCKILGPFLIEFANLFRITMTKNDIPSIIFNCPVTSTIIDAVLNRISMIENIRIEELCKLFGVTNIFDGTSADTKNPDLSGGITQTPEQVSTEIPELSNGEYSTGAPDLSSDLSSDLPSSSTNDYNTGVSDLSGAVTQTPEHISIEIPEFSTVRYETETSNLSTDYNRTEVPEVSTKAPEEMSTSTAYDPNDGNSSNSIFLDLVATDNEVSVSEIKDLLQEIQKGGNLTYANLLINLAEKYDVPLDQSRIPEELYNYNANYSDALAALDKKTGSIKMEELLELFGIKIHK